MRELLNADWLHRWPDWFSQAECKDLPPEYFFLDDELRSKEQDLPGRPVCWRICPVREQCLEYALTENLDQGIFGGIVSKRRSRMKGKLRRAS